MPDLALGIGDAPARVALVPGAVELFSRDPGEVVWLGLSPFLAPEFDQNRFVIAHDDPGIGAPDEGPATFVLLCPHLRFHDFLDDQIWRLVSARFDDCGHI
jgi:hypothetical protein